MYREAEEKKEEKKLQGVKRKRNTSKDPVEEEEDEVMEVRLYKEKIEKKSEGLKIVDLE